MLTLTGTAASGCMYVCIRIEIWLQLGYADKDRSILISVSTFHFIINFVRFSCMKRNIWELEIDVSFCFVFFSFVSAYLGL